MLRMGFAEEIDVILAALPVTRRTALFSATMPPAIRSMAARHLNDPIDVTVAAPTMAAALVRQQYAVVNSPERTAALVRVLSTRESGASLVFVQDPRQLPGTGRRTGHPRHRRGRDQRGHRAARAGADHRAAAGRAPAGAGRHRCGSSRSGCRPDRPRRQLRRPERRRVLRPPHRPDRQGRAYRRGTHARDATGDQPDPHHRAVHRCADDRDHSADRCRCGGPAGRGPAGLRDRSPRLGRPRSAPPGRDGDPRPRRHRRAPTGCRAHRAGRRRLPERRRRGGVEARGQGGGPYSSGPGPADRPSGPGSRRPQFALEP